MIIFIHEERAYLSWLARHRRGFVVDWLRKPTRKRPILHRASCTEIKRSTSRQTHWTTGRHIKVCGLDLAELSDWARDEAGKSPVFCENCRPEQDSAPEPQTAHAEGRDHLTSFGKEIIDYVLEIAVLRLDGTTTDYAVTVDDLAQCFGKSPAQLTATVLRLRDDDFLTLGEMADAGATLASGARIYPTTKALRTIPAFDKLTDSEISAELDRLQP